MGVNMAGNCIFDDDACREASKKEIKDNTGISYPTIRKHYEDAKFRLITRHLFDEEWNPKKIIENFKNNKE